MKKLIAVTALTLMCGSAFAQTTGPAPQTDTPHKPGMNNQTMDKGSMSKDTTGMNKGNMSRDGMQKDMSKDGSPAAGKKLEDMKK